MKLTDDVLAMPDTDPRDLIVGGSTAKSRMYMSAPMRYLLENGHLEKGRVDTTQPNQMFDCEMLDYGCGRGDDIRDLLQENIKAFGYDPYHVDAKWTLGVKWPLVTCIYVANVLGRDKANSLIGDIQNILRHDGVAFMAIRNDLPELGARGRNCTQTPWKIEFGSRGSSEYHMGQTLYKSPGFYIYKFGKGDKCKVA
jgi:hypothetical protein